MQWSFSSLKKFVTCPRQYNEVKVKNNYQEPETQVTAYGKEVHQALEDLVKLNKPLPTQYQKFNKFMDIIISIPGIKYPEIKLAVDKDKKPCGFDNTNYWVRGIVDLLIVDNADGYILDYKTGSDKYADTKQLKLMSALAFQNFESLRNIKAGLLFVSKEKFIDEEYSRKDLNNLWSVFAHDLTRLEHSFTHDFWPVNPSGLCRKHCVVSSCEYNGRQ